MRWTEVSTHPQPSASWAPRLALRHPLNRPLCHAPQGAPACERDGLALVSDAPGQLLNGLLQVVREDELARVRSAAKRAREIDHDWNDILASDVGGADLDQHRRPLQHFRGEEQEVVR